MRMWMDTRAAILLADRGILRLMARVVPGGKGGGGRFVGFIGPGEKGWLEVSKMRQRGSGQDRSAFILLVQMLRSSYVFSSCPCEQVWRGAWVTCTA